MAASLGLLALAIALGLSPASQAGPAAAERPNVLVVMTDDQTLEAIRVMDRVNARIGDQGVRFAQSFVNYPLCCPSRATFLTGQYASNHGVYDNALPTGGYSKLRDGNTLPVWLQRRGYYTGHMGKYLNGYGGDRPAYVPPGWSEWKAPTAPAVDDVYDYGTNQNGATLDYGHTFDDYKQDVITDLVPRLHLAPGTEQSALLPVRRLYGPPRSRPRPESTAGRQLRRHGTQARAAARAALQQRALAATAQLRRTRRDRQAL